MSTKIEFYKLLLVPAIGTAALLLIPFLAMQFNSGVNWSPMDFVVAGFLLFGTAATYKLVTRRAGSVFYKLAVAAACASGLFLVWVNLAVGIIGSENNHINIIYFGVVAVLIIYAVLVRFRAGAMAYMMFSMTGVLALIPVVLLILGGVQTDEYPRSSIIGLFGIHGFFALQFVISALLFHRAALEQNRTNSEIKSKQ